MHWELRLAARHYPPRTTFARPAPVAAGFLRIRETPGPNCSYLPYPHGSGGGKNLLSDAEISSADDSLGPRQLYRAITRHSDGRIIQVRHIHAHNDAEAIQIVTERGAGICTDLWSKNGLIKIFEVPEQ